MDRDTPPVGTGSTAPVGNCPLCLGDGGDVVWFDATLRVVLADEPDVPGFTRAIWSAHAREMTDLTPPERDRLMRTVWTIEAVMRRELAPLKVNLASLGNAVPHLHWHVVPRWADDVRFPGSPWSAPRDGHDPQAARVVREQAATRLPAYRDALVRALSALPDG